MNDAYRDMIRKTFQPDCGDHTLYCMVGLGGEVGEVMNLAQKRMRGDFDPEFRNRVVDELGGVFYFLTQLCEQLRVTPEEVMEKNRLKLLSRLERGTVRGHGDDR